MYFYRWGGWFETFGELAGYHLSPYVKKNDFDIFSKFAYEIDSFYSIFNSSEFIILCENEDYLIENTKSNEHNFQSILSILKQKLILISVDELMYLEEDYFKKNTSEIYTKICVYGNIKSLASNYND